MRPRLNERLQRRFENHAARTPSAIALIDGDVALDYRTLDRRANAVARRLRREGIGREDRVALLLDRSADFVAAMLGVLKAGAACVCIDPGDPRERVETLLRSCGAATVVEDRLLVTEAASPPRTGGDAGDLAFVFYTTGSTGEPKGVMHTHRSRGDRLRWEIEHYAIAPGDRVLLKTPVSFARVVKETLWALSSGATVVIARPGGQRDPGYLADLIGRERVTVAIFIPPQLALLLEEERLDATALRLVIAEGEPLPWPVYEQFRARLPHVELFNAYGLTEVSTVAVWRGGERVETRRSAPSGRAAGLPLYLLDDDGRPAGTGEIYVGGDGIARGYLGNAAETAARFLPDPFSTTPGARMYRTGDLGHLHPDGTLEHLGRADAQVKLHGFRVEPGEIEHVLAAHPGVREAAAAVREDRPGVKQLVAYAVTREDAPSASGLRRFLEARLPSHLVPSRIVLLSALPRTPNGKVDRRALPPPPSDRPDLEASFVAPRDEVERTLAAIWERLLGISPIGAEDDFFELGGYSLLGALLFAEIERELGPRLPLAALLGATTVARLAEIVRAHAQPAFSPLVVMQRGAAPRTPFFCVHGLFGNVLCFRELARAMGDDQPFVALQAQALDPAQVPLTTVEEMASYYLTHVRAMQPRGPYCLGGYSFGGMVAFEMAQQLTAAGERVALLALIDASSAEAHRGVVPFYYTTYVRARGGAFALDRLVSDGRLTRNPKPWKLRELPDDALLQYRVVELATTAATRAYRPRPYPNGADLIRATGQDSRLAYEPQAGWGRIVEGLRIHDVPGDHVTLLSPPWVNAVGERLRACVDRAQS